ncbi:Gfo/Idh/MocA family protein [Deinococcus sp. VB343]|uniref:Gfo/Idh/MocA family oxidoreductase n=1 Tax=Deinococcus sp. VB142 TaxID=3112952 RepID=A0AAU6Q356_9DEIO
MTTFRWGILGAARIAQALIPAIREAGGEVAALGVRDPHSERARAFAQAWDVPLVGGYQDVLNADVDAVYIPLPNDLHCPWGVAALGAGKHVLIEKPFALNAAEAQRLADAAADSERTLLEAFAPRFHPYVRRILALVQRGELGELRAVHATFGFRMTHPDDFRWNASQGGGALYDVGTYGVNFARLLLGEPLSAFARARWTIGENAVDLGLSGQLEYPGTLVTLECGVDWTQPPTERVTLVGTGGTLDTRRIASGRPDEAVELRIQTEAGERTEEIPPANAYARMVAHFQQAARGEVPLMYPPADAVAQARVLDALYRSARTGQPVSLAAGMANVDNHVQP